MKSLPCLFLPPFFFFIFRSNSILRIRAYIIVSPHKKEDCYLVQLLSPSPPILFYFYTSVKFVRQQPIGDMYLLLGFYSFLLFFFFFLLLLFKPFTFLISKEPTGQTTSTFLPPHRPLFASVFSGVPFFQKFSIIFFFTFCTKYRIRLAIR